MSTSEDCIRQIDVEESDGLSMELATKIPRRLSIG
jgi:hypothetical protein